MRFLITEKQYHKLKNILTEENVEPTLQDFLEACKVAKQIEDFWKFKGSDSEHRKFFSGFQYFWDDDDTGAANAYVGLANTKRKFLKDKLTGGAKNLYYIQIDDWLKRITEQIDTMSQDMQRVQLVSPDGYEIKYFDVDPEID